MIVFPYDPHIPLWLSILEFMSRFEVDLTLLQKAIMVLIDSHACLSNNGIILSQNCVVMIRLRLATPSCFRVCQRGSFLDELNKTSTELQCSFITASASRNLFEQTYNFFFSSRLFSSLLLYQLVHVYINSACLLQSWYLSIICVFLPSWYAPSCLCYCSFITAVMLWTITIQSKVCVIILVKQPNKGL